MIQEKLIQSLHSKELLLQILCLSHPVSVQTEEISSLNIHISGFEGEVCKQTQWKTLGTELL